MKTIIFFCLFFIFAHQGHCNKEEFCINFHRDPTTKIQRIKLFSERCSGSTFTHYLLWKNLITREGNSFRNPEFIFGHRHFPPDYNVPLSKWGGPEHLYTLEGSDDTLFIFLFRNPYDWLRSLRGKPNGASRELRNLSLSKFIRTPWKLKADLKSIQKQREINPFLDMNSLTGKPFENPMQLRAAKIKMMLDVAAKVKNFYIIQYESISSSPEEVLTEIASAFDLVVRNPTITITSYKGLEKKPYVQKQYPPISTQDLLYINKYLDEELENAIGYSFIFDPNDPNIYGMTSSP